MTERHVNCTPTPTREQVVQIASEYAAIFGIDYHGEMWESELPTVVEGDHEESDSAWIISWEESPYTKWVSDPELCAIVERVLGGGWFAEPVNGFCVAFWN